MNLSVALTGDVMTGRGPDQAFAPAMHDTRRPACGCLRGVSGR